MKYVIHKGNRRPLLWWLCFPLLLWKRKINRLVCFDQSVKYDLPGTDDDPDVNKLFGIGYFWNHHIDSARFGWNYDQISGAINIFAYTYVDGVRSFTRICKVYRFSDFRMTLTISNNCYVFRVSNPRKPEEVYGHSVPFNHNHKIGYKLGLYFGGTYPAPHKITIKIKKR